MSVAEFVVSLEALDANVLDRADVNTALSSLAKVRAWIDAKQAVLVHRLGDLAAECSTLLPQADIATASHSSRKDADHAVKRAHTLAAIPELQTALGAGEVSIAHVDVFTRAVQHLTSQQRLLLAEQNTRFTAIAARSTPEHFARVLRHEIHRLDTRAGETRANQQQRNTRLRSWFDPETGMWHLHGEFDPETGIMLQGRIDNMVDTMFHTNLADTCPSGHHKQDHLRALALIRLTQHHTTTHGHTTTEGRTIDHTDNRCDMSIIIDLDTLLHGLHEHSIIDNGTQADLPIATYRRMACNAAIIPTVLNSAGVVLDQGRTIRLANRNQRRALRAMYETCAMPDCTVTSKYCEPHHIVWWQHNGTSDLHNLLPLCSKHHHNIHQHGWKIVMATDRSLTITHPNGNIQTTRPPTTQRAA